MRGSGQRLPITLRFTRVLGTFSHTTCFPFSCALWARFSDRSVSGERSEPIGAPMPHAALWVVQLMNNFKALIRLAKFQCRTRLCGWCNFNTKSGKSGIKFVSMPHAALWVVQRSNVAEMLSLWESFNAARGFVGGATRWRWHPAPSSELFQCRTRLCGWCNLIHINNPKTIVMFQCRTRLCGWCNNPYNMILASTPLCFNAARGFVGGATRERTKSLHL